MVPDAAPVKLEDHVLGRRAGHLDQVSDAEVGQAIQGLSAHSLTLCDQPLISHFNGNPERSLSCTFAASGLQHIQLMLFDCEFDPAYPHNGVQAFREPHPAGQTPLAFSSNEASLVPPARRAALVSGSGVRIPATTSSPCALTKNSP